MVAFPISLSTCNHSSDFKKINFILFLPPPWEVCDYDTLNKEALSNAKQTLIEYNLFLTRIWRKRYNCIMKFWKKILSNYISYKNKIDWKCPYWMESKNHSSFKRKITNIIMILLMKISHNHKHIPITEMITKAKEKHISNI